MFLVQPRKAPNNKTLAKDGSDIPPAISANHMTTCYSGSSETGEEVDPCPVSDI